VSAAARTRTASKGFSLYRHQASSKATRLMMPTYLLSTRKQNHMNSSHTLSLPREGKPRFPRSALPGKAFLSQGRSGNPRSYDLFCPGWGNLRFEVTTSPHGLQGGSSRKRDRWPGQAAKLHPPSGNHRSSTTWPPRRVTDRDREGALQTHSNPSSPVPKRKTPAEAGVPPFPGETSRNFEDPGEVLEGLSPTPGPAARSAKNPRGVAGPLPRPTASRGER